MVEVLEYCKFQGNPPQPSCEHFRILITENRLLLNVKLLNAVQDPLLHPLSDYLKRSYEPVPASCLRDDLVYACKHCGWTVTWRGDPDRRMEKSPGCLNVLNNCVDPENGQRAFRRSFPSLRCAARRSLRPGSLCQATYFARMGLGLRLSGTVCR